jgi:hypothetical protein
MGVYALAAQTGVTLCAAVYLGFEGTQVILGSFIGLASAFATDSMVLHLNDSTPLASFAYSCVCAALGAILFHSCVRQNMLATLSGLVGALFLVSGIGTLAAQFGALALLSPDVVWLDAMLALFGNAGACHLIVAGVLAVLGSAIHAKSRSGAAGAAPMGLGLLLGAVATATGLGCSVIGKCPPWLEPVKQSSWPLLGGLAWMVTAVLGSILQLSSLPTGDEVAKKKKKKDEARQYPGGETQSLLTQPTIGHGLHDNTPSSSGHPELNEPPPPRGGNRPRGFNNF